MKEDISKELVFNYFSGRATVLEKEIIDKWVTEPNGREQFFIWLQEWENQNLQYQADIEQGMARYRSRINPQAFVPAASQAEQAFAQPVITRYSLNFKWLAAAAVLIFMLSGAWLVRDNIRYEIYKTDFSETRRLELSDGSKVILNANSSLYVPRFNFGKGSREVRLTGEANFNVKHTPDHKNFVVHTDRGVDIEVLGTEFNVYSRSRGTKVVLNKGKVQLRYQEGRLKKQMIMTPGDLVTMDEKGKTSIKRTDNPQNFSAWKAHRFVFEGASLEEVCNLFEDNFGVKVQIPDTSLARQTISGSFTALNAEELLDILADDSGLTYERSPDGKLIILSY
jgi:transmembrane sensor